MAINADTYRTHQQSPENIEYILMITGRDIICISSIEWDFLWQGHQEIASRLARAGNRVFYVENTGVRAPGLRDTRRVAFRLRMWLRSLRSRGVRQVAPNIYVCSPLVMPPFGSRWRRELNRRLFLPLIRRAVRNLNIKDAVILTYLPTDTAVDLIRLLRTPQSVMVYYCIADFTQLTPHVRQLRQSEKRIVEMSDLLFAQCPELAEHCSQWGENIHIFPFGVNLDAFPLADSGASPVAHLNGHENGHGPSCDVSLHTLSRPIIGYIGGLHRHVDFGLLTAMARARPQWSWVCVGPLQTTVGELADLPNVYLLGHRPHHELVNYIRHFDVCIVPYVRSLYTDTVVPVKINEYLAVGKPVVSTELPTVCEFNEQHKVLITAPSRKESFLHAIKQALRLPDDAATVARRRKVAALGDWQARLEAMSELIEKELKAKATQAQTNRT